MTGNCLCFASALLDPSSGSRFVNFYRSLQALCGEISDENPRGARSLTADIERLMDSKKGRSSRMLAFPKLVRTHLDKTIVEAERALTAKHLLLGQITTERRNIALAVPAPDRWSASCKI